MIEIVKRPLASAGSLALLATILIAGGVARAQCPATELAPVSSFRSGSRSPARTI